MCCDQTADTILFFIVRGIQIFGKGIQNHTGVFKSQKVPVPPAFQAFYDATLNPDIGTSFWVGFNDDIARHTRAWQRVLGQCDLMPKPPEI